MSNLLRYSTSAERLRGKSFFDIGDIFTGSNNKVLDLQGNEFNSSNISLSIDIYPDFNWDEDLIRVMCDTGGTNKYRIMKTNDASGNILRVYFGNVIVLEVLPSVYSQYWTPNDKINIVATGTSGNNKLYVKGNLVGSSSVAWSLKKVDSFTIGSYYTGVGRFIGLINNINIFKNILTPQEISDNWNNSTYNYKNKYRIHYPMTQSTHTGSQTLDVSGNNLHGTLIGAPTKLTGQGYNLDGSTQYITFPEQTFPGEFTLGIFSNPEMKTLDGFFGHTTDTNKMILFISGKVFVRVISTSDSTVDSDGAAINFLGLTRDADNKVDLYVNQNRYRLFGDVAQVGDSVWDYIGRTESGTQNFTGDIFETIIDNRCLTPTQMHDLSLRRFALDI